MILDRTNHRPSRPHSLRLNIAVSGVFGYLGVEYSVVLEEITNGKEEKEMFRVLIWE